MILAVISPSSISDAVAHESTYTEPSNRFTGVVHTSVILGIPPVIIFTVRVFVLLFPAVSV